MTRFPFPGLIIPILFIISGCLGPYDTALPDNPEDAAQMSAYLESIKELPADEQKDIKDFISRMRMAKKLEGYGYIIGTKTKEALEKQRTWIKENKAAQEKQRKEEEERRLKDEAKKRELLNICNVKLTKKTFKPSKKKKLIGDRFSMELKFSNKSDKDLSAIVGKLEFRNSAGMMLKTIKIPLREELKAGKSVKWSGDLPCNKSKEKDAILAKTPLRELDVTWVPEVYHFTDGTRVGMGF